MTIDDQEFPWDCYCGERYTNARAAWLCKKCRQYLYPADFASRKVTNVVTGEVQDRMPERPVPEGFRRMTEEEIQAEYRSSSEE